MSSCRSWASRARSVHRPRSKAAVTRASSGGEVATWDCSVTARPLVTRAAAQTSPCLVASTAASARLDTLSLRYTALMWSLTVNHLLPIRPAISLIVKPLLR